MLYCETCREQNELRQASFIIFDATCELCDRPSTSCYFTTDERKKENEKTI